MTRSVTALTVAIVVVLLSGIAALVFDGDDELTTPEPTPDPEVALTPDPTPDPAPDPARDPGVTLTPDPTPDFASAPEAAPTPRPRVGLAEPDPRDLDDALPHTGGLPTALALLMLAAGGIVLLPLRRDREIPAVPGEAVAQRPPRAG